MGQQVLDPSHVLMIGPTKAHFIVMACISRRSIDMRLAITLYMCTVYMVCVTTITPPLRKHGVV